MRPRLGAPACRKPERRLHPVFIWISRRPSRLAVFLHRQQGQQGHQVKLDQWQQPGRHEREQCPAGGWSHSHWRAGFAFADVRASIATHNTTRPLVKLVGCRFTLQRADLFHHRPPYRVPGTVTGQPRPLGPKRGIELSLWPMQADQMMGHVPEISVVHDYTCLAYSRSSGEQV